jgi:type I restriction enzyme S subunit
MKNICDHKVVSGLHTIPCRPKVSFGTGYLGFYMNSSAYHNQLLRLIQGSKISSISKSALENTLIKYPRLIDEQLQIGKLFCDYNASIILQQQKIEKLQNFKKACLEKMFV